MRTATLYNFLLEANIMASIAILLMALLRRLLPGRLSSRALRLGWGLIALRLLLPLSLPNPWIGEIRSPFAPDAAIRPIAGQIKVRLSDLFSSLSGRGTRPSAAEQIARDLREGMYNASLPIALFRLYLIGLALVVIWFIFSNLRFRRRLKLDRIEPLSGKAQEDYLALCRLMKLKPLPVYFVDPLRSACLVGAVRPCIALPLTLPPQSIAQVLRHELCHLRSRDHLWGIVRLACCALHWFNPLVWLAARMSYHDSELYCDEQTTRQLDERERQDYAATLLMSASRHHAPGLGTLATGISQTHRQLRARISSIMGRRKPLVWLSAAFSLLALVSLLGAFATSEPPLRPRLGHLAPFPEPPAQGIQSERQAFDWARQLMERPEFAIGPQENWHWERYAQKQYPDLYRIAAGGEQDAAYAEASFDRQGQLISLSNYQSPGAEFIFGNTPGERSDPRGMAEDLKRFIALARPGMEREIRGWDWGEAQIDSETFLTFIFFDDSPAQDGEVQPLALITVEARPQPRIIRVDFDPDPLTSNG